MKKISILRDVKDGIKQDLGGEWFLGRPWH